MTWQTNQSSNHSSPFQIEISPLPNISLDMWMETDSAAHAMGKKGLSKRESEVLRWVARGKTNGEIGTILSISSRTVSKHLENIYEKLGVESRTAAVVEMLDLLKESQYDHGMPGTDSEYMTPWKKVLLVDHDSRVRSVLRGALESHGYACEEVEHGSAALAWLETRQADLVIMDGKIRGPGSLPFLQRLQSQLNNEAPPVVVHTHNSINKNVKEKALQSGVYAILTKPCTFRELLSTVAQAIEESRPSPINTSFSSHYQRAG